MNNVLRNYSQVSRRLPATGELILLAGALGQRLLERALATGLAGDRQLGGPRGNAADERRRAFAAGDLDRCPLAELGEQPSRVVLRGLVVPDLRPIELEEVHADMRALPREPRDRDGAAAGNTDDRRLRYCPGQVADSAPGPQRPAERARSLWVDPDTSSPAELLDRTVKRQRVGGPALDRDLAPPGQDGAEQLVLPHRGLRQRPALPPRRRRDPRRNRVPVAVMVADDEQRPLQRQQLDTRHLQAPPPNDPGTRGDHHGAVGPGDPLDAIGHRRHATRISGRGLTTPLDPVPHAPGPPPRECSFARERAVVGRRDQGRGRVLTWII